MSEIVDFNKKKNELSLSKEIFLNLYLLYANRCDMFIAVDLDVFERSVAIHKKNEQFSFLLSNFEIEYNNNEEIVNFHEVVNKNGIILLDNTILLLDDRYLKQYEKRYNSFIKAYGDLLLFYIHNDLKYGIGNWDMVFEYKLEKKPKTKQKKKFTVLKKDN